MQATRKESSRAYHSRTSANFQVESPTYASFSSAQADRALVAAVILTFKDSLELLNRHLFSGECDIKASKFFGADDMQDARREIEWFDRPYDPREWFNWSLENACAEIDMNASLIRARLAPLVDTLREWLPVWRELTLLTRELNLTARCISARRKVEAGYVRRVHRLKPESELKRKRRPQAEKES